MADSIDSRYASPAYAAIYASPDNNVWRLRNALQALEDNVSTLSRTEQQAREWARSYFKRENRHTEGRKLRRKYFREHMAERRELQRVTETIRQQIADIVLG